MKLETLEDPELLAPGSARGQRWDALVEETEGIDPFCSSTRWALPAFHAFIEDGVILFGEGSEGVALLVEREHPSYGKIVHPLEAMWGFGSGVAGPKLAPALLSLCRALFAREEVGLLVLPGLPANLDFARAFLAELGAAAQVLAGPATGRARASLAGGREGFLSRRGGGLRRTLERARRRAEEQGVHFVAPEAGTPWPELYARIQAVEASSWKGRMALGIGADPMRAFYDRMGQRCLPEGSFRALFARQGETDLAYHFGAIHDGIYRGLQHAYVDSARQDGLGNLTHLTMIERIAAEGVMTYDLGQEIDYKLRWAEDRLVTRSLYLLPRR